MLAHPSHGPLFSVLHVGLNWTSGGQQDTFHWECGEFSILLFIFSLILRGQLVLHAVCFIVLTLHGDSRALERFRSTRLCNRSIFRGERRVKVGSEGWRWNSGDVWKYENQDWLKEDNGTEPDTGRKWNKEGEIWSGGGTELLRRKKWVGDWKQQMKSGYNILFAGMNNQMNMKSA